MCSLSTKSEVHLDVKKISNSFHATLDTTTLVRSVKTKRLVLNLDREKCKLSCMQIYADLNVYESLHVYVSLHMYVQGGAR